MRAVFFNGYAAEPKGALSWRFKKDLAGSGALGDLLSHVVDLVQYVLGADHRGERAAVHHPHAAADPADGPGHPLRGDRGR